MSDASKVPDSSKLSALPCGRVSKWVVLGVWIVIAAISFPLYGKLTGVQKNDSSQWLPKAAESTKALNLSTAFTPKDVTPAIIVYDRGGKPMTPTDRVAAGADAQRFKSVKKTKKDGTVTA